MRCSELALTVKKHVKREHGEAESVAELLYKEARRHHPEIGIERVAKEDIDGIGQSYGTHHRPKPTLHTVAADENTAENAAK